MEPKQTEDTNTRLVLPEEEGLPEGERRGDLPIEKLFLENPETGEKRPGFKSTWALEKGERIAIANGADIIIDLWGHNHPPLKPSVGEPQGELEALVTVEECNKAASLFFERLSERMKELEGGEIKPEEIPQMFGQALQDTVDASKRRPGQRRNGGPPTHDA